MLPLLEDEPWRGQNAKKLAAVLPEGKYTIGIRPEALLPSTAGEPGAISVEVDYCEEMGAETIVWCRTRRTKKTACLRLPRTSPIEAKAISGVEPDWSKVLVFDESGRRVRLNAEATVERVFNVEMRSKA